ncbi:MAG: F0F1 ATP synthase subunit B [Gammaproteobacteria bacterium]|jgi:F-type H+-transporting ATPase subunit b|nr:F0F1 ATP synthase subunit B [Gammaproteobacteria bacterium]
MNFNATLIGQLIAFTVFVVFCMKFIWPFIIKAMEDRETRIADGLAAAEKGQVALSEAEVKKAEMLEESKQQAAEIISQGQKRHDEIVESAKDDARSEKEKILAAAQAEIEQQRTQTREQLRSDVANLALVAAEQILMREVDRNAHNDVLTKVSAEL